MREWAQARFVMLLQVISVLGALMVLSAYGLIQGGVWRELDAVESSAKGFYGRT